MATPFTIYKRLIVWEPHAPPDPDEIAAVEQALGVALPPAYRDFLNALAGGRLEEYSVRVPPTPDGEPMAFCDVFRPGKDARGEYGYGTLLGELRAHRGYRNLPQQVLPIAQDGGGSTVYLDLTEPAGAGRVVAFVHGLPEWTGRARDDAFVQIAPDFDAYLDLLFLEDDYIAEAVELLEDALRCGDAARAEANREFLDLAAPGWRERFSDGAPT